MPRPAHRRITAFTIIELLVVVCILLVLLAGLGFIFRTTTHTISASQSTLTMLANVRALQDQMSRDFTHMDRYSFCVLRSRVYPSPADRVTADTPPICIDQVAFVTLGNTPYQPSPPVPTPLSDQSAHAAIIWYGHLVVEGKDDPAGHYVAVADQSAPPPFGPRADKSIDPYNILPSGDTPEEFVLGRHATLLLRPTDRVNATQPASAIQLGDQLYPACRDPRLLTLPIEVGESVPAHISSSRIAFACLTQSQLMQDILNTPDGTLTTRTAAYCFRFKTLAQPWATDALLYNRPSLPNAAIRMQAAILNCVTSFQVQFQYAGDPLTWSPPTPTAISNRTDHGPLNPYFTPKDITACSLDPASFPVAVRITLRVADPQSRIPERTFIQIIKIPH